MKIIYISLIVLLSLSFFYKRGFDDGHSYGRDELMCQLITQGKLDLGIPGTLKKLYSCERFKKG